MATLAPLPLEYVQIYDLPPASALPEELRGKVLFSRVNFVHSSKGNTGAGANATETTKGPSTGPKGASGDALSGPRAAADGPAGKDTSSGKAARSNAQGTGSGFNFTKALKAGLDGAGTSVTSRGDGKYEGGRDFLVSEAPGGRAKMVHLTPDALAAGNAEQTLAELDRLQQLAGARQRGGAASTSGAPSAARPPAAATRVKHADALAAAAHLIYDISDEDGAAAAAARGGASGTSSPAASAAGAAAGPVAPTPLPKLGEAAPGLPVPEYSVRELAEDGGPTGQSAGPGRLEVCVSLPEVASPCEVEVWLAGGGGVLQVSVPGKYGLKLALPCPVIDDTSRAKWSKAKRRLTLTLTKAGGR